MDDCCRRFAVPVFVVQRIRGLAPTAICCHRFAINSIHRFATVFGGKHE